MKYGVRGPETGVWTNAFNSFDQSDTLAVVQAAKVSHEDDYIDEYSIKHGQVYRSVRLSGLL